ncbi:MAG: YiiX/YebB-like N1pC/P60 family cysteine hydrolase [Putridiphycobacter sp.]
MKFVQSLLLLMIFVSCSGTKSAEEVLTEGAASKKLELSSDVLNQLQDGDIILRKGEGPLSAHLMINTKEEYTHCGIIFNDNGKWKAIHSIGAEISNDEVDGVQTIDLDKFVSHAADSTLFICRPVFTENAGEKVINRAQDYLAESKPFDHRFSLLSTDKLYCSELLYHIFKDVNNGKNVFDIKKKHKSYMLMFSTFFKEKNFAPIFDMRKDA